MTGQRLDAPFLFVSVARAFAAISRSVISTLPAAMGMPSLSLRMLDHCVAGPMLRRQALAVLLATLIASVAAQDSAGTAVEAKAMLDRAAAAVRANKGKAIGLFNADESEFKDRDLYVFCFNVSDGIVVAGPALVKGMDARELRDERGKAYGREMLERAKEGTFVLVEHLFTRPGSDQQVRKHSFVTRVADQVCGVGHYTR